MKNLKVHEKLSKAQRLMQGRRFRVLKEIDEEIENEVKFVLFFFFNVNYFAIEFSSVLKIKKIVLHLCVIMHHGLLRLLGIVVWKMKVYKILLEKNVICLFYK